MGMFCFLGVINPTVGLEGGAGEADFCTHHQTLKPPWEPSSILMASTARLLWLLGEDLFITLGVPFTVPKIWWGLNNACGMGFGMNHTFVGKCFFEMLSWGKIASADCNLTWKICV